MEEDCVILSDSDVFSETQSGFDFFGGGRAVFESDSCFFAHEFPACEDSNILELSLPVISKGRSFDCANFEVIFESVEDESGEQFALNVLSNYQERLLLLEGELEERQDFSYVA